MALVSYQQQLKIRLQSNPCPICKRRHPVQDTVMLKSFKNPVGKMHNGVMETWEQENNK